MNQQEEKYTWVSNYDTREPLPETSPTATPADTGYWRDNGNRHQRRAEAAKARRSKQQTRKVQK
jgi:hypothetical protein